MWGAGCIFVEMLLGYPAFPGVRDTWDQLDKIFRVVGTPTEDCWPGVSRLPNYRPHKLVCYPAPPRGQVSSKPWTRRKDINILTCCFPAAAGARLAAAARHPLRRAPGERAAAAARAEARVRGGCAAAPLLQRPAGQPAQPPPPGQRVQRAGRHLQPRQRQVSSLPHCIDFGAFMPSTPSI